MKKHLLTHKHIQGVSAVDRMHYNNFWIVKHGWDILFQLRIQGALLQSDPRFQVNLIIADILIILKLSLSEIVSLAC